MCTSDVILFCIAEVNSYFQERVANFNSTPTLAQLRVLEKRIAEHFNFKDFSQLQQGTYLEFIVKNKKVCVSASPHSYKDLSGFSWHFPAGPAGGSRGRRLHRQPGSRRERLQTQQTRRVWVHQTVRGGRCQQSEFCCHLVSEDVWHHNWLIIVVTESDEQTSVLIFNLLTFLRSELRWFMLWNTKFWIVFKANVLN